jgi:hypothetical protein
LLFSVFRKEKEKICLSQNSPAAALRRRQPAWRQSACSARPRNPPTPIRAIWNAHCLPSSRRSLRESTANKGGHRARAMDLVRQAIEETQAGVEFADEHGGRGR